MKRTKELQPSSALLLSREFRAKLQQEEYFVDDLLTEISEKVAVETLGINPDQLHSNGNRIQRQIATKVVRQWTGLNNDEIKAGLYNPERDEQLLLIQQAVASLSSVWLESGLTPPDLTVKQISRRTKLAPERVIRLVDLFQPKVENGAGNYVLSLANVGAIKPATTSGYSPTINDARDLGLSPKRVIKNARYESCPPGGGPVQRARVQDKNIPGVIARMALENAKISFAPSQVQGQRLDPIEKTAEINLNTPLLFPTKSMSPLTDVQTTTAFMKQTAYWSGDKRQQVSPDIVTVSEALVETIRLICDAEAEFLANVSRQYKQDVESQQQTALIKRLEGNLTGSDGMKELRRWSMAVTEPPTYFRLDLGCNGEQPFVAEVNTITCGTPPAMLYREAQGPVIGKNGCASPTSGALEYFFNWIAAKDNPLLALVGTTPKTDSQLLYEQSHADMARLLTDAGIPTTFMRLLDLKVRDDAVQLPNGATVQQVYWFGDPIWEDGSSELLSPQGQALRDLYQERKLEMIPSPMFPLADNKAIDTIVWEDQFADLVPPRLRSFVPKTEVVETGSAMCDQCFKDEKSWQRYILKPTISIGGGVGVSIGKEKPRSVFLQRLKSALKIPGSAVIQEFKPSTRVPLRTLEDGRWRERQYYPRIEPTVAVANGIIELIDLFFTGRYETRKVGGANNCVMSTVVIRNEEKP